jgi:hypothetical protein
MLGKQTLCQLPLLRALIDATGGSVSSIKVEAARASSGLSEPVVVTVVVNRPQHCRKPGRMAGFHVRIAGADTRI